MTILLGWAACVTAACKAPATASRSGASQLAYGEVESVAIVSPARQEGRILFVGAREGVPTGQIQVRLQAASARAVQAVEAKTASDVSYFEVYLSTESAGSEDDMFSATVSGDSSAFTIKDVEAGEATLQVGAFDADGNNITKDEWVSQTLEVSENDTVAVALEVPLADGTDEEGGKIKTNITVKDGTSGGKLKPSLESEE